MGPIQSLIRWERGALWGGIGAGAVEINTPLYLYSLNKIRGWTTEDSWLDFGRGKKFALLDTARLVLGPTQHPIQWILRALSSEMKRPRREAISV